MDRWIFNRKVNCNCKYRLFCLPYAGSGASLYSQWSKYIDDDIEVCPIQLPGRENRRNESLCCDCKEVVSKMVDGISDLLDKPFAIFGYSMGGILAYELTLKLYNSYGVKPIKLFMSASSTLRDKKPIEVSQMTEGQLTDYMKKSGGIPLEILNDTRYCKEYFPIIKNDYQLIEHYKCNYTKVPCDIVAFASKDDKEVYYNNIKLMRFFTHNFELYQMFGNHFFIRNEYQKLGEIVSNEILSA